ncbi:MAG: hypothetical protein WAM97_09000 [Acidimicrobiales bacterium]
MRNVWKGLVVGGLTGVGAGMVLDSLSKANKKASELGRQVRDHAPEAGRWVHSVSDKAGELIHDADVPEHLRDTAHRIKDSGAGRKAAKVGTEVAEKAKKAVSQSA